MPVPGPTMMVGVSAFSGILKCFAVCTKQDLSIALRTLRQKCRADPAVKMAAALGLVSNNSNRKLLQLRPLFAKRQWNRAEVEVCAGP